MKLSFQELLLFHRWISDFASARWEAHNEVIMPRLLKRVGIVFIFAFIALVLYRGFFVLIPKETTDAQVTKIHATKLTLDDVMGKNLPPTPSNPDATIAGVDANQNGIRDDVELAIFKEYPNSAKTRAVLLQYALALQMEVTQPRVNAGTVGAVANEQDRAFFCSAKLVDEKGGEGAVMTAVEKYGKFVSALQFNNENRKKAHKDFYSNLESGTTGESSCDIDLATLPD